MPNVTVNEPVDTDMMRLRDFLIFLPLATYPAICALALEWSMVPAGFGVAKGFGAPKGVSGPAIAMSAQAALLPCALAARPDSRLELRFGAVRPVRATLDRAWRDTGWCWVRPSRTLPEGSWRATPRSAERPRWLAWVQAETFVLSAAPDFEAEHLDGSSVWLSKGDRIRHDSIVLDAQYRPIGVLSQIVRDNSIVRAVLPFPGSGEAECVDPAWLLAARDSAAKARWVDLVKSTQARLEKCPRSSDRKSTRLNSSHVVTSRMPSSA